MIEFKQVNKWFGKLHVLNDINLEIEKGEVLVICGPSGSGKSTLIRCINRLEPIQEGQIIVDGVPVHDKATNLTKLRADIGFVFQQFHLYPHMTVLQNVMLAPVNVRKMASAAAEEISRENSPRWDSPTRPGPIRPSCPGASSSGWPLPGAWPCRRK